MNPTILVDQCLVTYESCDVRISTEIGQTHAIILLRHLF
jgi:hypothetical protein